MKVLISKYHSPLFMMKYFAVELILYTCNWIIWLEDSGSGPVFTNIGGLSLVRDLKVVITLSPLSYPCFVLNLYSQRGTLIRKVICKVSTSFASEISKEYLHFK